MPTYLQYPNSEKVVKLMPLPLVIPTEKGDEAFLTLSEDAPTLTGQPAVIRMTAAYAHDIMVQIEAWLAGELDA